MENTVTNPVNAEVSAHHQGNRIALENVRQRLRAHFGDSAALTSERVNGVYRVRMELPLVHAGSA